MPGMPRPKGKALRIALAVLGVPQNRRNKQSERDKRIEHRLLYSETSRVR